MVERKNTSATTLMIIFAYLERRPKRTRHLLGLEKAELEELLEYVRNENHSWNQPEPKKVYLRKPGGGAKGKLSLEQQVCLCLFILRQGVTFEVAGLLFGISGTRANELFHQWLSRLRAMLPASLWEEMEKLGEKWECDEEGKDWLVDSFEQARERPSGNQEQKQYYSSKKATHTFKSQIFSSEKGDELIDIITSVRGPRSDIGLFREQKEKFSSEQRYKGDKAYVGEEQIGTPKKKPRGGELTEEQKQENREFSRARIYVEHAIRRIRIYRMASIRYRWNPSKHGDVIAVICGLVRIRLGRLKLREFARRLWSVGEEIRKVDREVSKMALAG